MEEGVYNSHFRSEKMGLRVVEEAAKVGDDLSHFSYAGLWIDPRIGQQFLILVFPLRSSF